MPLKRAPYLWPQATKFWIYPVLTHLCIYGAEHMPFSHSKPCLTLRPDTRTLRDSRANHDIESSIGPSSLPEHHFPRHLRLLGYQSAGGSPATLQFADSRTLELQLLNHWTTYIQF